VIFQRALPQEFKPNVSRGLSMLRKIIDAMNARMITLREMIMPAARGYTRRSTAEEGLGHLL
jgi:hypothetical protein